MGRYSNKEISLLNKCIGSEIPLTDIKLLLKDHGFYRTYESIENKIQDIIEQKKQKAKEAAINYANKNLVKHRSNSLFHSAKARAVKKNLDFNLTKEWIEERVKAGHCERTGIKFVLTKAGTGRNGGNTKAPSLDRIDPNKGYTIDNTRVVINNYNKLKGVDSDAEIIKIARAIVKNHEQKYSLQINE